MRLYPLELLVLAPESRFGRAGHQESANSFFGELNIIWTAGRLARKGLAHSAACPLYDQVEETADHPLVAPMSFYWASRRVTRPRLRITGGLGAVLSSCWSDLIMFSVL
jgi:hypothetical protein